MKIEDAYLKTILWQTIKSNFPEAIEKSSDKINFRCNICKDSAKSKIKKRGWIVYLHDEWKYKCWNCGISLKAKWWLKKYFPTMYEIYIRNLLQQNDDNKKQIKKTIDTTTKKENPEKKEIKYFQKITNNSEICNQAISICEKRKIPKEKYLHFFVVDNEKKCKYKNRIIIPTYNEKNKIIWWQGRSIYNQEPKYLNCTLSSQLVIKNCLKFVDRNKPIIVVEGIIDSFFINNCISTVSTNWSFEIQKLLDQYSCYYLIDYDSSEETKNKCIKLIETNHYVFNWQKFIKENHLPIRKKWDINDLFIYENKTAKYDFEYFEKYFTNNYYDLVYFKV